MFNHLKKALKYNYKKMRFNLSASNNAFFIGFYKYLYKPKKGSLNDFLNKYSRSKKSDLTVIQIGANDGITHDPIHKFIKRDNWQGVLLEPQSNVFNTFLSEIYKKNKGIHTINAAIGKEDGNQILYKIGFSNMRWATGLASFNLENVERAYKNGIVKNRCEHYGLVMPESKEEQITSEDVTVICPDTIFNQYNLKSFDLLQIDTEGFDYEVIKIFNIAKTQPKVIVYENTHLSKADRFSCEKLLESNDYSWKDYDANTLAMKKPLAQFSEFF